jgi:hypothetical protein
MSRASPLLQALKLAGIATTDKETVGVVTIRVHAPRVDSCDAQLLGQSLGRLLTTAIASALRLGTPCDCFPDAPVSTQLAELSALGGCPERT